MGGWKNSKSYNESLARMPQPILPSQLPKVKMNLAGLSQYAKEKGVSLYDLTEQELSMFVPLKKI